MTETSGSLGKRCWRREESEEKQPRQPRQREPPTYETVGTQAATRKSPRVGTSRASTSAAPIGAMSLSAPRHLRQHRPPRPTSPESGHASRRGPTSSLQSESDDDDDLDINKVTEIVRKEQQRLARRRAAQARYRARHPERVAESRRRYRAKHPEVMAAQRQRYHARHRDRIAEARRRYQKRYYAQRRELMRRYYKAHAERLRQHKRQFYRSEVGQRWQAQYLARKRETAALLRQQRGPAAQKRTLQKMEALGPLKVTVMLEDFMTDFCNSLSPSPEDSMDQPGTITDMDSMDQPGTITDMDSGVVHPLDHAVGDESSLSSCDMWDGGKGFLDNLLEELDDLPPPSDDCWFDFLTDMMPEDPSFDLENFVS